MKAILALALLIGATPAAAVTVETAKGDWSGLPALKHRSSHHFNPNAVLSIQKLASTGQCTLPWARNGEVDARVSFAAQFGPDGTLNRVVMPQIGCPRAETLLGGVLVKMIEGGDYKPSGENPEGWYRGELSFQAN